MSKADSMPLKLRVTEALGKDVGRAFARMDPEDLQRLGLAIGEVVEVSGKRTTVCKAMPAYKEQRGQSRIQIDGLARENAGAALDEIEQVSHQIASLVQNISSSAKDQSSVSAAINKNMQVLRQISAKTTESTAATSTAISKLSELASQLRRTVRGFTLPDGGAPTGILSQATVADGLLQQQDTPDGGPSAVTNVERLRQSG